MNIALTHTDTSLEEMFQRMGQLLKDIAATKSGLSDDMENAASSSRVSAPGVGERLDLSA